MKTGTKWFAGLSVATAVLGIQTVGPAIISVAQGAGDLAQLLAGQGVEAMVGSFRDEEPPMTGMFDEEPPGVPNVPGTITPKR